MARPSKEPPVPSALAPALLRFVRAQGGDTSLLADRIGLDSSAENADEAMVTASASSELLAAASEMLGEPFLALRLPADLPLRRYGHAELASRASATIGEALARIARYASLVHPAIECELEVAGDDALWHQRTPGRPRGLGRHAHEYALAYVLTQARRESALPLFATRAWFSHPRPPDLTTLHRFFGTRDLAFGEIESGFALPSGVLSAPMLGGDPRLLATATELAEAALRAQPNAQNLTPLVTARIEANIAEGASMDALASALHMSSRTLQRRLEQEGTRFSEVVDGVREKVARVLIKDESLTLSEIAYRLGFADLATFSRAFKRWTGRPPGGFRRG
jgi:AraC-like DNA-binding protein